MSLFHKIKASIFEGIRMKNKTLIAVAISLIAVVSAVSAQQIVRPVPASSITDNRVTSIFVMPVPDLSGYALSSDVQTAVNNGSRNWTSYFLGQTKGTYDGRRFSNEFVTIFPNGRVYGAQWLNPYLAGNPQIAALKTFYANNNYGDIALGTNGVSISSTTPSFCAGGIVAYGTYVAYPLYTAAAALVGGAPYDWKADFIPGGCPSSPPDTPGGPSTD